MPIQIIKKLINKLLFWRSFNKEKKKYFFLSVLLILLTSLFISVLTVLLPAISSADWYNSGWQYRKALAIDHTKVSDADTANLTNFPVLVSLTDGDLKNHMRADGYDLLFTSSDGKTKLDHEIEKYDSSTGTLVAWVEVPTLYYNTQNTTIYMYYGNPTSPNQQNKTGVWDTNYVGVWHFNESSGNHQDSSTYSNHASTTTVTNQGNSSYGKVDGGDNFDGTDDIIEVADNADNSLDPTGDMTWEGWIKFDSIPSAKGEIATVIRKINNHSVSPYQSYRLYIHNSSDKIQTSWHNGTTEYFGNGNTALTVAGGWYHAVAVRTGTNLKVYLNGADDTNGATSATNASGSTLNAASDLVFGNEYEPTPGKRLDGQVDEVRISKVARSAGWINTQYANQNSPSTFFASIGVEEPKIVGWYNDSWKNRKRLSIDKTKVTGGPHNSFPILVSLTDTALKDKAQSDGDDILFTSSDGFTKLDHEIERYTSSSGELIAWVRIPNLSNSSNTDIFMYYGNANATNQQNATSVWDSNYVAVYHFNEASGTFYDSTTNNNDSTSQLNTTYRATGKVGYGVSFANNGYISIPNSSSLNITGNEFTGEAYANSTSFDAGSNVIFKKNHATENQSPYQVFTYSGGGFDQVDALVRFNNGGSAVSNSIWSNTAGDLLSTGSWYHIGTWWTNNNALHDDEWYVRGIKNGAFITRTGCSGTCPLTNPNLQINSSGGDLSIGNNGGVTTAGTHYWNGSVDEVRISNVARTVGWLATSYENINAPSTFFATGTEENIKNPPILHLKFDDAQGTTAQDSSASNLDGTLAGTTKPTWLGEGMCVLGKCLYFEGTTANVTVPNISNIKSVSFWVKPNSTTQYLLNLNTASTINVWINNGILTATNFASPTYYVDGKQSQTIIANKWQHVTITTNTAISGANIIVGNVGANYLNGFIDDLKLYNTALTADQVKVQFNSNASVLGSKNQEYLSEGLLGYWKMDESTGINTLVDASGNSNNASAIDRLPGNADGNTPPPATVGKYALSRNLDGTDDYLSINSNSLRITGDMTVSFWMRTDNSATAQTIFVKDSDNNVNGQGWGLTIGVGGGSITPRVVTTVPGISQVDGPSVPVSGSTWYHIVAVWKNGQYLKLFKNGEDNGTTNTTNTNLRTSNAIHTIGIGYNSGLNTYWEPYDGLLDEFRVYNRALSAKEISDLYNWAPGPVAYWDLEEGSGQVINDKSGNITGATLGADTNIATDDPLWTSGKYGSALKFDGSSDYANTGNQFNFAQNQSFTIQTWMKTTHTTSYTDIIDKGFGFNNTYTLYYDPTNGANGAIFAIHDSARIEAKSATGSSLSDDKWHFLVGVRDTTTDKIYIYVDGILKGSTNDTTTGDFNGAYNVIIGARGGGSRAEYFNGSIDDIKIYNYTRTQKQIIEDMNGSHPSVGSPIGSALGHFKFDEGYGDTSNNSGNQGSTLNGNLAGSNSCPGNAACPTWTNEGKFSKALSFDGNNTTSGDYITFPNGLPFTTTATSMTVSTWFKSNSGQGVILGASNNFLGSPTSYDPLLYITDTGTLHAGGYTSTYPDIVSSTAVNNNAWHHAVLVIDYPNIQKLYVDGKLVDSEAGTNAGLTGTITWSIGMSQTNTWPNTTNCNGWCYFNGSIDELKFYNYALTDDEVLLDMNQGKSMVLGSLSTSATGRDINSAKSQYCPPGNTEGNCADNQDPSPIGEWKFEEGSGTTLQDTSGNNNYGTITTGNGGYSDGKVGKGFSFDGSTSTITMPHSTYYDSTTGTWEGWFKTNQKATSNGYYLFGYADASNNGGLYVFLDETGTGKFRYQGKTTGGSIRIDQTGTRTGLNDNKWHHWVLVFDGTNQVSSYIDGTLDSTWTPSGVWSFAATASLRLSKHPAYFNTFSGTQDQIIMYNYKRSAAQIAWDYNKGAPIAHWKFDECQGQSVYDSSGNNLIGTINLSTSGTQTTTLGYGSCTTNAQTPRYNGRSGRLNAALNFDGSNDYISLPSNMSIAQNVTSFTMSAWIKPAVMSVNQGIIGISTNAGGIASRFYMSINSDNTLSAGGKAPDTDASDYVYTSSAVVTQNSWQHVVATIDIPADTIYIYQNGIRQSTTGTPNFTNSKTDSTLSLNGAIGSEDDGSAEYFNGQIDDVRIYNYALTDTQIKNLYNGGAIKFSP